MNSLQHICVISLGILILSSCGSSGSMNNKSDTLIDRCNWLIGTWENHTSQGVVYEEWQTSGRNEISAKSYKIVEGDTTIFETIRIKQKDNKLYYIPTVSNQNDAQPISFTSTSIQDDILIFENVEHDFPQKIQYKLMGSDSLRATISGLENGELREIHFNMKRITT